MRTFVTVLLLALVYKTSAIFSPRGIGGIGGFPGLPGIGGVPGLPGIGGIRPPMGRRGLNIPPGANVVPIPYRYPVPAPINRRAGGQPIVIRRGNTVTRGGGGGGGIFSSLIGLIYFMFILSIIQSLFRVRPAGTAATTNPLGGLFTGFGRKR